MAIRNKNKNLIWLALAIIVSLYFGFQLGFSDFSTDKGAVIGISIEGDWTSEECKTLAEGTFVADFTDISDCKVRNNIFSSDQCVCNLN